MINLNMPFYKLPNHIKQWARDNGFVLKETETSAVVKSDWQDEYRKAHVNGNEA